MNGELPNPPELVTDAKEFARLRGECAKIIDIRKRLPDFVFKKTFTKYFAIENGLIFWKSFPVLLSRMAKIFEDGCVNYMTVVPDAVDYYHRHCSFFGAASFAPSSLEERYFTVMSRGGAADSFQARGGDVGAFWGSSYKWAISTDRISWELAVIAVSEDLDVPGITGFPCFDGERVASYVASQYGWKGPADSTASEFSKKFLGQLLSLSSHGRAEVRLNGRGLLSPSRLNFDVDIHQRNRRRRHSRNPRGLAESPWLNPAELLLHFARESADRSVVEPNGNRVLLRFLKPFHRTLLLQQIAFVLDLGFDGLEFVADFRRSARSGLR
jgi:hypothetical protein